MTIKNADLTSNMNLQRILGCYIMHPEYIEQYWLDDTDIPIATHRRYFKIIHTCNAKGYKYIDNGIINSIIEETEWLDDVKKSVSNYFEHLCDRIDDNLIPDNIDAYYTEELKYKLLRQLNKAGYDISYYYYDDVDPDVAQEVRDRFDDATPSEILEHYEEELSKMRQEFSVYSSGSVMIYDNIDDMPDVDKEDEVLIDGMLNNCTLNSIVAEAKAGKSFYAYQMAHCVQNGIPFLDRATTQKDVLYVDFELSTKDIKNRCLALDDMFGVGKRFSIMPLADRWGEINVSLDSVIEAIKRRKKENPNLGLVIFDCFYRFCEGDGNKEEDVMQTLSKLKLLSADMAVVYVHHSNKTGVGRNAIYSGGGSGAHGKIVNQTYVLESKKDGIEVTNTGRTYYNDKFSCRRDSSGYFIYDGASVDD